jgi:CheY-like chemotaxis protein
MSRHILVVEDDERISSFIRRGLEAEGYLVDVVQDGQSGVQQGMAPYDLIILDLMLPDQSGHEVCHTLRREQVHTPILILTAKDALEDKLSGFDHGADDYLTKPFAFGSSSPESRPCSNVSRPIKKKRSQCCKSLICCLTEAPAKYVEDRRSSH